jgi:HNH endonuclease
MAVSDATKDRILREAAYRCAVPSCGATLALDVHHIVEVSRGGGDDPANLLALCGTHHDLYHRGVISQRSIREWKNRLIAVNQIDIRAEIQQAVNNAVIAREDGPAPGEVREGFSLATGEFLYRTCEIGFVYNDTYFVPTGYCCFVKGRLALTTAEVVRIATEVGTMRGGFRVIRTLRGFAPFEVKKSFDIGTLALIERGEIDDAYVVALLAEENDKQLENIFTEPLETPVKYRLAPFCGEHVGFLHAPSNSEEIRARREFQFDSADVSFNLTLKSKEDFLQYALTPVSSHIQHRGSPVFTADARLVGAIKETIRLSGEAFWRPIVSAVFPLKEIIGS